MLVPHTVKKDFPIFDRLINGRPLVYLDSGATSQKPRAVLDAERTYYEKHNANVHRGAHTLGDEATKILEESREAAARFIGGEEREIIFTRNTTEGLNLVAYTWALDTLKKGDVVLSTEMEHHSNIVPWHEAARRTGARVELVRVTKDGLIDTADFENKLKLKPKLVAMVHVSNALGTINPVAELTRLAHKAGAVVVVDGAQAVPHLPVRVKDIGCDFYAFSGHKMLGPMGIGVLWGRRHLLESMSPFLTGGGQINEVFSDHATWADVPEKFEAGTPNVAGAAGLAAAIDYLTSLNLAAVREHDAATVAYALEKLSLMKELTILGTRDASKRSGSVSFIYSGVHAHDVATILDSEGVAVRSGHHCTMVLHEKMGLGASIRASFNVYTTKEDIDALTAALVQVKKVFGK